MVNRFVSTLVFVTTVISIFVLIQTAHAGVIGIEKVPPKPEITYSWIRSNHVILEWHCQDHKAIKFYNHDRLWEKPKWQFQENYTIRFFLKEGSASKFEVSSDGAWATSEELLLRGFHMVREMVFREDNMAVYAENFFINRQVRLKRPSDPRGRWTYAMTVSRMRRIITPQIAPIYSDLHEYARMGESPPAFVEVNFE